MGMKLFSASSSCECGDTTVPVRTLNPNPDPYFFVIKNVKQFAHCYVSRIQYPNCTNFEGEKILVTRYDPRSRSSIDPHFFEGSGLIARFEPSVEGADLAIRLAQII